MIVVADSGPLHYLILLDLPELLHRFYGQLIVPESVRRELTSSKTPLPVKEWISKPPAWLRVHAASLSQLELISPDLDLGERMAESGSHIVHMATIRLQKRVPNALPWAAAPLPQPAPLHRRRHPSDLRLQVRHQVADLQVGAAGAFSQVGGEGGAVFGFRFSAVVRSAKSLASCSARSQPERRAWPSAAGLWPFGVCAGSFMATRQSIAWVNASESGFALRDSPSTAKRRERSWR